MLIRTQQQQHEEQSSRQCDPPSKDSLYCTILGWLMLARTATSLRDSCLSLHDICQNKGSGGARGLQPSRTMKLHDKRQARKFARATRCAARALTPDMPISLMTYWRPSSLDFTRTAFPKEPSPIFFTFSYLSMLTRWLDPHAASARRGAQRQLWVYLLKIAHTSTLGFKSNDGIF